MVSLFLDGSNAQDMLFHAAELGSRVLVLQSIDAGARIDCRDEVGWTVLHWCAGSQGPGHTDVANILLREGADPNVQDQWSGHTPLHVAALRGNARVAAALLAHGANPESRDKSLRTPLHLASARNHVCILRHLISVASSTGVVNARDNYDGWTPLHHAASGGAMEAFEFLLAYGADPEIRDKQGRRAIDVATDCVHKRHTRESAEHPKEVKHAHRKGHTPRGSPPAGHSPVPRCFRRFDDVLAALSRPGSPAARAASYALGAHTGSNDCRSPAFCMTRQTGTPDCESGPSVTVDDVDVSTSDRSLSIDSPTLPQPATTTIDCDGEQKMGSPLGKRVRTGSAWASFLRRFSSSSRAAES
eukprot:jgi/Mesvir1/3845/Mv19811-RA.1